MVSTDKGEPVDDLARARESVLALLAGSGGSVEAPTLHAAAPLRAVPAAIEAKLANRAAAGLAPLGTEHPRGTVWRRVVLPSGLLAALDAVGLGAAAGAGHTILAVGAGVLLVLFAGLAVTAAAFATRDPLRLTTAERLKINHAGRWRSTQPWKGPLAFCSERSLVVAATYAAERIARSSAWRSGRLDEHRVRLDLAEELDQIDAQAFRIATARYRGSAGGLPIPAAPAPVVDAVWETTLTRVAALTCYADSLDGLAKRQAEALARQGDPVRDSALLAGSVQDEIASDDLAALTYFYGAAVFSDTGGDLGW